MERVEVYLGLGSNLGNRDLHLLQAVNRLDQAFGMHPERISRIVESPALGFDGPDFLNLCLLYSRLCILSLYCLILSSDNRSGGQSLYSQHGQRRYKCQTTAQPFLHNNLLCEC